MIDSKSTGPKDLFTRSLITEIGRAAASGNT
jgi:hypothetical protein